MKTIEDFVKEGKTIAEATEEFNSQRPSLSGYEKYQAIRDKIVRRPGFPAKGKKFEYVVTGIVETTSLTDKNDKPYHTVEVTIKAANGKVANKSIFATWLLEAEDFFGKTLAEVGAFIIKRNDEGEMSYMPA